MKQPDHNLPPSKAEHTSASGSDRPERASRGVVNWEEEFPELSDKTDSYTAPPGRTLLPSRADEAWGAEPSVYTSSDSKVLEKFTTGTGDALMSGLEYVVRRKKLAATVLALTTVVGAAGVVSSNSENPSTSVQTVADQNRHDGAAPGYDFKSTEAQTVNEYESLIMKRSDLPEVGTSPIELTAEQKNEQPAILSTFDRSPEAYPENQFVGSYQSITGLEFNIYSTNQDGSAQRYELNPVAIEFVLSLLKQELPGAPENDAKLEILSNLDNIQSGQERRIMDIVLDVSKDPTCIDSSRQVIDYTEQACAALGVTYIASGTEQRSSEQIPILVTDTGIRQHQTQEDGTSVVVAQKDEGQAAETTTLMHEVGIHGLGELTREDTADSSRQVNSYEEGDDEHELAAYLGVGGESKNFDFKGAKGQPLDLLREIRELSEANKLPPILVPVS